MTDAKLAECRPTQRAPDWRESARFQTIFLARSQFRQSSVISSRPPAGNAIRWAENQRHSSYENKSTDLRCYCEPKYFSLHGVDVANAIPEERFTRNRFQDNHTG